MDNLSRIFDKIDAVNSSIGNIEGDVKVINTKLDARTTEIDVVNIVNKHSKDCPSKTRSIVPSVRNEKGNINWTTLLVQVLKYALVLAIGGGAGGLLT